MRHNSNSFKKIKPKKEVLEQKSILKKEDFPSLLIKEIDKNEKKKDQVVKIEQNKDWLENVVRLIRRDVFKEEGEVKEIPQIKKGVLLNKKISNDVKNIIKRR